jgi:hypothetical protein
MESQAFQGDAGGREVICETTAPSLQLPAGSSLDERQLLEKPVWNERSIIIQITTTTS